MSLVHVSQIQPEDIITYRCEDARGRRWTSEAEVVDTDGDCGMIVTEPGARVAEWEVEDDRILTVRRPRTGKAAHVDAS